MPIGMAVEQGSKIEIFDIAGYLRCTIDRRDGMVAFSHYWVNVRDGDAIVTFDENGCAVDDVELLAVFTPHPWLLESQVGHQLVGLNEDEIAFGLSKRIDTSPPSDTE
ncbi:hypothetical protein [Sphingomonas crocodyli]|uniref:Uncharacterized protein n=1 Tax=Sphingomonas crocodyli TaxID=1979270 RepID=A0A437LXS0_9SPHN|nr:hypothetical protein [Sphingomonas crocodyli]RVT90167.1 hypothetical protein EOD43_17845 [Sphingomonas crocodyli]